MSKRREQMRLKAKRELAKKTENLPPEQFKKDVNKKEKKPPSFLSGAIYIFGASMIFSIASTLGQTLLGILAAVPFGIIGASRIIKSGSSKPKVQK